ncbi:Repeat domain-containing protein [Neorhodopirellula lusitana]|uniref:Repeat domain-containing protein n=1 Tax=Neorhodopirellula lusitana TaxID=445327 RepID=A0ABY1QE21_9BACT|nr:FG-GAP-like repeat-containing protein [Neorhodopirellula lusitana]SMP66901.1 Repeat domain-containing protein [Neorhodopirellula lusitana]
MSKNRPTHKSDRSDGPGSVPASSAGGTSGSPASGLRKVHLVIFSLVMAAVGASVFSMLQPGVNDPGTATTNDADNSSMTNEEKLDLTRSALAHTENLEMVQADETWTRLHQATPDNASVALNLALNRVLRLDELSSKATNATLDAAQKQDARSKLPNTISAAREAIQAYSSNSADQVTPLWLSARVDLHEASLLPGSMTRSMRNKVYARLTEAIEGELGEKPESMILGGTLIQVLELMEDPIDGLPKEVLPNAARTVGILSDRHPDNLFFAMRAARLNIEARNQAAADVTRRVGKLTSAIKPSLATQTEKIGLTPDGLIDEIVNAVEAKDWSTAESRNMLSFNVLNSSEIVKTDRRRAMPHPLDRLSFDYLRTLSAAAVQETPIAKSQGQLQFERAELKDGEGFDFVQAVDFDLDLDPDLVAGDRDGGLRLFENSDKGWKVVGDLKLDISLAGVIVADLYVVDSSEPGRLRTDRSASTTDKPVSGSRHDTFQYLVAYGDDGVRIVSLDGGAKTDAGERMQMVETETGLADLRGVTAVVTGDLEADGDLDLVCATEHDGVRMFVNRGNRTFFELPAIVDGVDADDPVTSLAIADLDRDLDLDVVTTHGKSGRVGLLENLLHLQFRGRILKDIPAISGASSVTVEDVDGNVSWDLVVVGDTSAAIVFSQTAEAGAWVVDRVQTSESFQQTDNTASSVVADWDNDSWMELLVAGSVSRIGPWGWTAWQELDEFSGLADGVSSWNGVDFDSDGGIDLGFLSGRIVSVAKNKVSPRGHYVDLRFKGIDDNASGRVNHFAIGSVLEVRFGPHYRSRIVTTPATHFGINDFANASSVRAILPNGLTKTIANPTIDSVVEEEQTLKGSCPYLYAWDGQKYAFVTDCLWAAPLGLQVAWDVVAKDRPWEYLKIDGRNIRPKDGRYEFRITEELWEVAYLDKVQLTAVDHPANVEVWTNEKVGPASISEQTLFAFASDERRKVVSARDTKGRDVTKLIEQQDQAFVQGFDRRLRQGLCPPHWVDLDFGNFMGSAKSEGNADESPSVFLVLTGWIMPTDASLNIQIDQNPILPPIEFPSVWVPDTTADSGWRNAIPYMGFPGGKTKTIVVDVTDVLNRDDPRFRIRTSAQIYWDSAEVVVQDQAAETVSHDVELLAARVDFHGFSQAVDHGTRRPDTYDYDQASTSSRWPPLRGRLTGEGDCLDLVREWDDQMVVISSGDEVQLQFATPVEDPPPGWVRDFVLHNVGWDKDADLNTLTGQQTGPLPYRSMLQYPPGISEFQASGEDSVERKASGADGISGAMSVEELNRKHLSRSQTFRSFWYRQGDAPAMRFTH